MADTITSNEFPNNVYTSPISTLHYPQDLGLGRHGSYINFFIHTPQKSNFKQSPGASSYQVPGGTPSKNNVFAQNDPTSLGNSPAVQSIATQNATQFMTNAIPTLTTTTVNQQVDTSNGVGGAMVSQGEIWASNALNAISNAWSDTGVGAITNDVLNFLVTGTQTQLTDVISLYMPDTVSSTQMMVYDNTSLTEVLGEYGLGGAAIASGVDAAKASAGSGLSTQSLKTLATNPVAMEYAAGQIAGNKNVGGYSEQPKLQDIMLNRIGYAVNPQIQVLFKNIDFRTFQYEFLFSPKSKQEADTVTKIIKTFKFHAAPEISTNTLGRYFIVPSTFDIEYMMAGGNHNDNLHKISTCALTSIYTDYAPIGFVTYDDGMPVQIRLILQFTETEIMSKARITEGY